MMATRGHVSSPPASAAEGAGRSATDVAPIGDPQGMVGPDDLLPGAVWPAGLPASLIGPVEWRPSPG
jgi:hypothetical protein